MCRDFEWWCTSIENGDHCASIVGLTQRPYTCVHNCIQDLYRFHFFFACYNSLVKKMWVLRGHASLETLWQRLIIFDKKRIQVCMEGLTNRLLNLLTGREIVWSHPPCIQWALRCTEYNALCNSIRILLYV